jgi:hypothetical protein
MSAASILADVDPRRIVPIWWDAWFVIDRRCRKIFISSFNFVRAILPGARRARTPGRQPQVDNLGSFDMAVTPALIVHGILAFTALAFISCGVFGRVWCETGCNAFRITKLQGIQWLMTANPFLFESKSGKSRYTRLFACISEEEDCYTVQVRLSNETKPEDSAWGEEVRDGFWIGRSACRRILDRAGLHQDRNPNAQS